MKKFLILALLVASASCLTSDEYDDIYLEIFKDIRTSPSTASTIVRLSKYKQVFITFFQKYFSLTEEILYSISAVSDQGSQAKPLYYWCSFLLGRRYHLTRVVCASQKYFFHIGCKWEMNVDQAHGSTHCGPTSTLSTWPYEQRLFFIMIFVGIFIQINNFFKLLAPGIEPLILGSQVQRFWYCHYCEVHDFKVHYFFVRFFWDPKMANFLNGPGTQQPL